MGFRFSVDTVSPRPAPPGVMAMFPLKFPSVSDRPLPFLFYLAFLFGFVA